jgi:hypothetical protein
LVARRRRAKGNTPTETANRSLPSIVNAGLYRTAWRTGGSGAPNRADRQHRGTVPAARTVPSIDWNSLLGISCKRWSDGRLAGGVIHEGQECCFDQLAGFFG